MTRTELREALLTVRRHLCAYARHRSGEVCDCKFGVTRDSIKAGHETGCGCPEVLAAVRLLGCMTDQEFDALEVRSARVRTPSKWTRA